MMPYPNGYSYRRKCTIDHTQVHNSDQVNFPVLIPLLQPNLWLRTVSNGGLVTNANGYDIIFTSDAAGQTLMDFERVGWNATTGMAEFWVRIANLSHTADTIFYLFYGNSSVTTDQANPTGVWDSNFVAVWHFGDGTTLNLNDSTSNGCNLTNHGATAAKSVLTMGQVALDSNLSQYLDAGNPSVLQITGAISAQAYQNLGSQSGNQNPGNNPRLFSKLSNTPFNGYEWAKLTDPWDFQTGNASTITTVSTTSTFSPFIQGWAYDNVSNFKAWEKSISFPTLLKVNSAIAANIIGATSEPFNIGRRGALNSNYYIGGIDELRISNIARGDDWMKTDFDAMWSPKTFVTIEAPPFPNPPQGFVVAG